MSRLIKPKLINKFCFKLNIFLGGELISIRNKIILKFEKNKYAVTNKIRYFIKWNTEKWIIT